MNISLRKANHSDYRFFYKLLKNRSPDNNISHTKMPTYSEHVLFNKCNPYIDDCVILDGRKKIGRVYITVRNEIGIHLISNYENTGVESIVLNKFPYKALYANVSPKNKKMQKFFKSNGFELIQYTYRKKK